MSNFKLALFDMDGTLLRDRTIFILSEKKGFKKELIKVMNSNIESYKKTIKIAEFLKDMESKELLKIFRHIPLNNGVEKVIETLKDRDIITAIATDSYQLFADDLMRRLGIDYVFANKLIINKGIITGEVKIHNNNLCRNSLKNEIYSICKSCVLEKLCKKIEISRDQTIAVGDGIVDISMLKKAGLGIAFNAPEIVQKHANIVTNEMNDIVAYI